MTDGYLGRPATHWAPLLSSDDPVERRLGAYALGEIGPSAAEVTGELAAALSDPAPFVRVWAAAALATIDQRDDRAIPALVEGTRADQAFVRSLAAWMLGRVAPDRGVAGPALTALERLRRDEDPSVCAEAAHALERLTVPRAGGP